MKTIVIDPGHGGSDRSNRGYSGKYIEADGNLEFALYLKYFLKDDFKVILTRDRDRTISLTDRGKIAKGSDMFISVHSDAGPITAGGVTVYESINRNNTALGNEIGKATADSMGISFRGTKKRPSTKYKNQDYYTVIQQAVKAGCPIVFILERGFHSNPKEEQILLNTVKVRDSAFAVSNVIRRYYNMQEKSNLEIIPDWAKEAIESVKSKKIMNGYSDGTFKPKNMVTRDELAVAINNLLKYLGK
ncbi:N-acetylmuramoyl-L-alanine amidase [Anaerophilus nitritogenes]|uniref:N-acetylmuramoyl-L-alanine amidase n=1 Tax=Anaerophilus nitritogenes TaxID=2498136 RepID=UPI00101D50F1|nr:N-acetylmuramoyl-L-alanine amidase [Anaerophilus nitritogenes]